MDLQFRIVCPERTQQVIEDGVLGVQRPCHNTAELHYLEIGVSGHVGASGDAVPSRQFARDSDDSSEVSSTLPPGSYTCITEPAKVDAEGASSFLTITGPPQTSAMRKRFRESITPPGSPFPAAALRAALANRSGADSIPIRWRPAAAAMGISGTDAFICHLGRSVGDALRSVSETAEAARAQLRKTRAALIYAVNSRCDELEASITTAESDKIASLERELCSIDAALESYRADRGAVAEAAATLEDFEIASRHAELTARLDVVEAQLLALPTSVNELPYIGLVSSLTPLLANVAVLGRVVSPRAVMPADLALENAPRHVRPGGTLRLRLVLDSVRHVCLSTEELEVSLGAAASATCVEASLKCPGAATQPLNTIISADVPSHSLCIACDIPFGTQAGSMVEFGAMLVYGQPVAGVLQFSIQHSLQTPLKLKWVMATNTFAPVSLCISSVGQMFIPQDGSSNVTVFDADGYQLSGLPVADLGLSTTTSCAAFSFGASPVLLLADDKGAATRLVAVNPTTHAVMWTAAPGLGCSGLAVLPNHGVVVFAPHASEVLFVHRLSDGVRVGKVRLPEKGHHLAADATTGAIFGNTVSETNLCEISRFAYLPGIGLRATDGVVAAVGERHGWRPLAVVPSAAGKRVSHLVVGTMQPPELLVFALPELTLVHTHKLKRMLIHALAADPWGEALAVGDNATDSVHVLAWPLPGMPVLE